MPPVAQSTNDVRPQSKTDDGHEKQKDRGGARAHVGQNEVLDGGAARSEPHRPKHLSKREESEGRVLVRDHESEEEKGNRNERVHHPDDEPPRWHFAAQMIGEDTAHGHAKASRHRRDDAQSSPQFGG